MTTLASVLASNAILAALLAIVVALLSRVGPLARRPAVIHGLWLLVLLKLFTPPLVHVPVPVLPQDDVVKQTSNQVERDTAEFKTMDLVLVAEQEAVFEPQFVALTADAERAGLTDLPMASPTGQQPAPPADPPSWTTFLLALWIVGSLIWFALAAIRSTRFHKLLRLNPKAPASLVKRVQSLSDKLALSRPPIVFLAPGKLSPMVWCLGGRPRLVIPRDLWNSLGHDQQDSLLVHELAHLKRRDHWVRGLEMLTLGLHWWNPIVWWACRELREAEEQCCDAWVVWALPSAGRSYAAALLECLDFLSTTPKWAWSAHSLPVGASGIGRIHDLKRRLHMIMSGKTPRSLTWTGCLGVVGLAGLLMPLTASFAQEPQEQRDEPRREAQREPGRDADADRARAELRRAEAQLEEAMAKLREAERRLQEAAGKAAKSDAGKSGEQRRYRIVIVEDGKDGVRIVTDPASEKKDAIMLWQALPKEKLEGKIVRPSGDAPKVSTPVAPKVQFVPRTPDLPAARGGDTERRINELERRLEEILRELKSMKQGGRSSTAPEGGVKDRIFEYKGDLFQMLDPHTLNRSLHLDSGKLKIEGTRVAPKIDGKEIELELQVIPRVESGKLKIEGTRVTPKSEGKEIELKIEGTRVTPKVESKEIEVEVRPAKKTPKP